MKKYIPYALKGLAVVAGVLFFVYVVAYTYLAFNRKKIITQIKEQVADKLNGNVQIGDISLGFLSTFPHISVLIENVSIKDTLFSQHRHPFLEAEKIYLNLSITSAIQNNNPVNGIRVEKGQLYVYTDTSGYTNAYLFTPKKDIKPVTKTSASKLEIENVRLKDVRLILNNEKKLKLYDFDVANYNGDFKTTDSTITVKAKNNILIHSLAFNTAKGSFAKEARIEGNFKLFFNKIQKQLSFNNIDITIKEQPFSFSGVFHFIEKPTFLLKIASKNLDYNFARTLLIPRISEALSVVKIEKPITAVEMEMSGLLNEENPLVHATYSCSGNNIQSPFVNFTNCSFSGLYTNEVTAGLPRKDPNSRLEFHNFSGTWNNLIIKSKSINLTNLVETVVNADIKTEFDLTQLNTLLGSNTLDLHQGKGLLDIMYNGPLKENTKKNTLLNGKCTFSNGILMYHPRNIEINNLNGNITFKNSDVFVNDFRGNVQGSKIIMNGSSKNLLTLLKNNSGKMFLDWNIYSPSLNLGSFTSLLKQRTSGSKSNGKSGIGSSLDKIINEANFRLNLKTDELIYKRFRGTNVKASLGLVNENWQLNNVSLNLGGGSMLLKGYLNEKNNKYYTAKIAANMQNIDVNKILYAFNNFGQNGISAENLRGKLTSTADVKMDISRGLGNTPENMEGYVNFSLKKGALLHYAPLKKIQEVAFANRNFDEVYFAELKDRFDIKNREVTINRMEIQSTVFTLFIEGIYSLQGKTDISIQVPLSNIKKRDESAKLENQGTDAKGGKSIYIRGVTGDDGNIKFKLDLFRKFRKKNKKEKEN